MAEEKACGAVIISGDEFLVVKKREGHWEFPKGHIEKNETEEECAKREVYEETGLRIKLLDNFRTEIFYYPKPGVLKKVIYFMGFPEFKKVKSITDEIVDHKWLSYELALKQLTFENAREVLRKAYLYLQSN